MNNVSKAKEAGDKGILGERRVVHLPWLEEDAERNMRLEKPWAKIY